jgi:penicillin-binding protein 1A
MQVARNFFLTREKTITRKLREVLLAWKIEANLSKDEILQLYVNQIFLGQRAYGFAAARRSISPAAQGLGVAEAAMLAGLPKAVRHNPVTNPRAKTRQMVLRRMHDLVHHRCLIRRRRARRSASARAFATLPTHAESVAKWPPGGFRRRRVPGASRCGPPSRPTRRPPCRGPRNVIDDRRHGYRGRG